MALFDAYKNSEMIPGFNQKRHYGENPIEKYDGAVLVAEVYAQQDALDEKVHDFLARVYADDRIAGNFNLNEEWRCWLERDAEASKLFYDPELKNLDKEAKEAFQDCFAVEFAGLLEESRAIDKMAQSLDELKLFKTCLFNVFNNGKELPIHLYLEQVFTRAPEFGMTVTRHSKDDFDLMVSFDPLEKVNRGNPFFSYELYMRFNHNHKKECHVYSIFMLDASSSDVMYSGPISLPVYNVYSKFSKETDACFLNDMNSIFYQQSLRAQRAKEKEKYGIPADYFEGTFVDPQKLVSFSEKSYQYGNSKIFIPKSQIAFAGDKVYMKRWLYAKLKRPVEQYEANLRQANADVSLDEKVASAAARAAEGRSGDDAKGIDRDSGERL